MTEIENWLTRRAESEAQQDILSLSDRVGNLVGVVLGVIAFVYFVLHQTGATGFFTAAFGPVEMVLFYGFQLYQAGISALKALVGRKNLARFFEAVGAGLGIVVLAWFWIVFPFEFTHVADILPEFLRFLLQWLSNDLTRAFMIVGIIASIIVASYNTVLYLFVRKALSNTQAN